MSDSEQLELEGVVPQLTERDRGMVRAALRTLGELERLGTITPRHALQVELVLKLAEVIDKGTANARASAVAMAARELRETLLVLDPPPADPEAGAQAQALLDKFLGAVEQHANQGGDVT